MPILPILFRGNLNPSSSETKKYTVKALGTIIKTDMWFFVGADDLLFYQLTKNDKIIWSLPDGVEEGAREAYITGDSVIRSVDPIKIELRIGDVLKCTVKNDDTLYAHRYTAIVYIEV